MKVKNASKMNGYRWTAAAAVAAMGGVAVVTAGLRAGGVGGTAGGSGGQMQIPATLEDLYQPGTQPGDLDEVVLPSGACSFCHGGYDDGNAEHVGQPYDGWVTSMMAQSTRDPVWHAALTVANQDVNGAGEFCIRCHSPGAWLAGRSTSGTLEGLDPAMGDFDGVNCHFCHRMVDPVYDAENPAVDQDILAALDDPTAQWGNGQYVVDPIGARRGPYDDIGDNPHFPSPMHHSPFHRESQLCGTCHDVSNPLWMRQPDGTYTLTPLDEPHPTQDPHDMFPEQRTYSEWQQSQFAAGGVVFEDGRFGGSLPDATPMQSCQDCHMPDTSAGGCAFWSDWDGSPFPFREDLPRHLFLGANSWVIAAVHDLYDEYDTGLTAETVAAAQERNLQFMREASDMELSVEDGQLKVRIINYSGHKLPTGYPEGRRMWLNVKFFDADENLVAERGAYESATAHLDEDDTKVYHVEMGMDETAAALTNLSAGQSFHLTLNNTILFDNRIPPIGFTNAGFESVRAEPVGYTYEDGQHWDDTLYDVPPGAASAVVTLYHQTSTVEYMEFLRDTNVTDDKGQIAYDQWVKHGRSTPVDMDSGVIEFQPAVPGDLDQDGVVGVSDLLILLGDWGACRGCPADLDRDGSVSVSDLLMLLSNWG